MIFFLATDFWYHNTAIRTFALCGFNPSMSVEMCSARGRILRIIYSAVVACCVLDVSSMVILLVAFNYVFSCVCVNIYDLFVCVCLSVLVPLGLSGVWSAGLQVGTLEP